MHNSLHGRHPGKSSTFQPFLFWKRGNLSIFWTVQFLIVPFLHIDLVSVDLVIKFGWSSCAYPTNTTNAHFAHLAVYADILRGCLGLQQCVPLCADTFIIKKKSTQHWTLIIQRLLHWSGPFFLNWNHEKGPHFLTASLCKIFDKLRMGVQNSQKSNKTLALRFSL